MPAEFDVVQKDALAMFEDALYDWNSRPIGFTRKTGYAQRLIHWADRLATLGIADALTDAEKSAVADARAFIA